MQTVVEGEYLKRTVKKTGNSSHVLLPLSWLGSEVYVARKAKRVQMMIQESE